MLRGTRTQNQIWSPPHTHTPKPQGWWWDFVYLSLLSLLTQTHFENKLSNDTRTVCTAKACCIASISDLKHRGINRALRAEYLEEPEIFAFVSRVTFQKFSCSAKWFSLPSASFLHPAGTKKERYRCTRVTLSIRGRSPSDKDRKHFPAAPPAPG